MKHKRNKLIINILEKLAPQIGAKVIFEPKWGIVSQITFKNGKRRYSRYRSIDINPLGASEVAVDKDYANFFMGKMGYPIIEGRSFCSPKWAKAIGSKDTIDAGYRYAVKLGLPIIVKPNSGSQGAGVALVYTKVEYYSSMKKIFKNDRMALVQRYVQGRDYRIVVLDNKVISGYERVPLSVVGDGKSTIKQLLEKKKKYFTKIDRDTNIVIDDVRIKNKLKQSHKNFKSILVKGEKIFLLDNANLSTGGDSVGVTDTMHKDFKKFAIKLTKDMGLRICGVDLMINGDITLKPKKFWVIEINAAPGLDHYVTTGKAQRKIVEDLYLEVLKSMEK